MGKLRVILVLFLLAVFISPGCDEEGGESTTGDSTSPSSSTDDAETRKGVNILRPSPCQRIHGPIYVNLSVKNADKIETIYVSLGGVVKAVFDKEPFAVTLREEDLPEDGSYMLRAVAVYMDKKSVSDEVEIRIDLDAPYYFNLLVLDADANPLGLSGKPGALFRINPSTGTVCTLASSPKFVNPSSMVIEADGSILVSDFDADMNGSEPGVGTIFRVLPDRFNSVSVVKASSLFRMPVGMDIDPNSGLVYVADADAYSTGAIFAVDPGSGNVTTVLSNRAELLAPIGVTVDPSGDLWVVDADANPYDSADPDLQFHGSVWRYRSNTGDLELVAASDKSLTPFQVLPDGNGDLLLMDSGYGATENPGKLFIIDLAAGDPQTSISILKSGLPFRTPAGFVYDADIQRYLIADRNADTVSSRFRGAVLSYNPASGDLNFYYLSDKFVEPFDVAVSRD